MYIEVLYLKILWYTKSMNMKSKGFTLIELLVVVAIIGILATVVLASLSSARERARDAKRLADVKTIQNALEIYHLENGRYPSSALLASGIPNSDPHNATSSNDSWGKFETRMGITLPRDPVNDVVGDGDWLQNTGYAYFYRSLGGNCEGQEYELYYKLETDSSGGGSVGRCGRGPRVGSRGRFVVGFSPAG